MEQSQAARVLLVRAVEESRPDAIPPETLIDALSAAGEMESEDGWLSRRAAFLLDRVLVAYKPLLAMTDAPTRGWAFFFGVPMLVGLASNYLGPSAKIHVLLNPIALLIAWNIGVYAALAARVVLPRLRSQAMHAAVPRIFTTHRPPAEAQTAGRRRPPAAGSGLLGRLLVRRLLPAVWFRLHRVAGEAREHASEIASVGRAFWSHWIVLAQPFLLASARRALHCAAIGITLGAVAGMYVRGLFFEYNVIWRSTFITEAESFVPLIRIVLGPAAALLGEPLPGGEEAALLTSAGGAPAAKWIHLFAVSALIFVVVPRLVMAVSTSIRMRWIGGRMPLDLGEKYYRTIIEGARALQVQRIAEAIRTDVRVECAKFAEALATFVCDKLYDARIAPRIRQFREQGGKVSVLEEEIGQECEAFQDDLVRYLPVARHDFERSLKDSLDRTIGRGLTIETLPGGDLTPKVGAASEGSSRAVGGSLGTQMADVVSAGVAAAAAVVAGTVSGGFGHALGVAILVGVVKTGPVGWVLGAVGGLAAAGAGWWLGRDRLAAGVKQLSVPAVVVKATLWESRLQRIIADGRTRCHASVREVMDRELEPLTPRISEQIWTSVKPLLGEQQRVARSADDSTDR